MPDATIHFIMGKGGVGRSSTAILLAEAFAKQGQSIIIVECNGSSDIPEHFAGEQGSYTVQTLRPNIDHISVSPMSAIEDYAIQQLKLRKLYTLIFENRLVQPLIEAAPGLHDAVQLGKIYDLWVQKKWHHIIVDCPATGHGLSLINGSQTMMNIAKRGPLYEQNKLVDEVIRTQSRLIMVTLPEELPCKETLELWQGMHVDFQQRTRGIILNQWQELSDTLKDSVRDTDLLKSLDAHPSYHSAFLQILRTDTQQNHWLKWLQTNLATPNQIPILKYPKWSAPNRCSALNIEAWR